MHQSMSELSLRELPSSMKNCAELSAEYLDVSRWCIGVAMLTAEKVCCMVERVRKAILAYQIHMFERSDEETELS